MANYEQLKNIVKDNKEKVVYGACFILVFFLGFGTGKAMEANKVHRKPTQLYYTENNAKKPEVPAVKGVTTTAPADTKTAAPVSKSDDCKTIKGNISAKGVKIYHMPGGAFYKRVKPEECFSTEAEAEAAGFKKSSR